MRIDAAEAARRTLEAVEAGGACATVLAVAGEGNVVGRRVLLIRSAAGNEEVVGSLGTPALDEAARTAAAVALDDPDRPDGLARLTGARDVEAYVEVRRATPALVVVGAGHIARPLCEVGALLGYRVVVVDDRPDFATHERFPRAERVVRADFSDPFRSVPLDASSHVVLVTRGHKYDYQCLLDVLRMDPSPAYVGMIGSRRRVRATYARLLEEGIARERLERVHAPVGLDVGAETPEEIAVAVAAELVLARRGGTGAPLRDLERVARRFFPGERDPEPEDRG